MLVPVAGGASSSGSGNVVQRFGRLGGGRPSTVLLFEQGDFCRLCGRSTIGTTTMLTVRVASEVLPSCGEPMGITSFPRSTLSICLPELVHSKVEITVYSTLSGSLGGGAKRSGTRGGSEAVRGGASVKGGGGRRNIRRTPSEAIRGAISMGPTERGGSGVGTRAGTRAKASGRMGARGGSRRGARTARRQGPHRPRVIATGNRGIARNRTCRDAAGPTS